MNLKTILQILVLVALLIIAAWLALSPLDERAELLEQVADRGDVRQARQANLTSALAEEMGFSSEDLESWILDENVAEDYFSVVTATTFLNYPQTPLEVYESHINAAQAGNPESMYRVSKAFTECAKAPRNREHFEDFYLTRSSFQQYWTQIENAMERCLPFSEKFAEDLVYQSQSAYWRGQAAEAGYQTAQAEWIMSGIEDSIARDPRHQELKDVLRKAVQNEGYVAYYQMANYLERIDLDDADPNDPTKFGDRPNEAAAWRLAGCKLQEGCNHNKYFTWMKRDWYEYEVEEFLERLEAVETSLSTGDF